MKALSPVIYTLLLVLMKPRHHTNEFVLRSILGDLGNIQSGTDGNPSKNDVGGGITTTSRQLHATQHLFENSSRLGTCEILMKSLDEKFQELEDELESGLAKKVKKQRNMLRNVITPMLAATKVSTEAAAAQLAPIPSVKRYNEQQEVRRRKAVK